MRNLWRGRNLIGLSCLLTLASCAVMPSSRTTSTPPVASVAEAESVAPAVSSIAFRGSPARGDTYGLGETVEVSVRFDRAVTATGSAQVALTIGTQTRHATLSSWSRQSLYFSYTVQEEDRDEDGVSIAANALLLNGGTIKSGGTIGADLTHGAVAPTPPARWTAAASRRERPQPHALQGDGSCNAQCPAQAQPDRAFFPDGAYGVSIGCLLPKRGSRDHLHFLQFLAGEGGHVRTWGDG